MEALFNTVEVVDHVANDTTRVTRNRSAYQLNNSSTGKTGPVKPKEHAGKYDKKRKVDVKSDLQASGLSKKCTKKVGQCENGNVMSKSKKSKLNAEGNQTSGANKNGRIVSSPIGDRRKSAEALKRHQLDELNNLKSNDGRSTVNEEQFQ
ncbi:mediator of DNA damage checkpoint protein, partial [Trifolium medium]|nr:mediator of DNA damage checkpoint protein [Trifolium medium]